MGEKGSPNHLAEEKSPYLLQHAYNPVDWYPWGNGAFEKAKKENKLIFLSIGYSTCHWCHVMERESFGDHEVASVMNDVFVSVKVDREERPDLDRQYMTICEIMTGAGGWPLTIIMTPEKYPVFAATYIPKRTRSNRIGIIDLADRLKQLWQKHSQDLYSSARQILDSIRQISYGETGQPIPGEITDKAFEQLYSQFDEEFAGFGGAPKFPQAHNLLFLLRYHLRTGDERALHMVESTMLAMRTGGIYDHIGYGFHRYSVDEQWVVPHFEKMLYDQAMLAMAYIEAYQVTKNVYLGDTARQIFTFVQEEMMSGDGGFYSAIDSDSEGEEGKFYTWKMNQAYAVLDQIEAQWFIELYNLERDGNYADEATGRRNGRNVLFLQKPVADLAMDYQIDGKYLDEKMEIIRKEIYDERKKREHPKKDDKILTDWNGLMIAALSKGAQAFDDSGYSLIASGAADFLLHTMCSGNGRLFHRYRDGSTGGPGQLNDYTSLIWGLLELYEATFKIRYLKAAVELSDVMFRHFWDNENGGFFMTADDAEVLYGRQKEFYDGALPSGNSMAVYVLLRLARITGDTMYEDRAEKAVRAFPRHVIQMPAAYSFLMTDLEFRRGPSYEIVISGNPQSEDTRKMLRAFRSSFIPNKVMIFRYKSLKLHEIVRLAPYIRDYIPINGRATAYICRDFACQNPTTAISEALDMVKRK